MCPKHHIITLQHYFLQTKETKKKKKEIEKDMVDKPIYKKDPPRHPPMGDLSLGLDLSMGQWHPPKRVKFPFKGGWQGRP